MPTSFTDNRILVQSLIGGNASAYKYLISTYHGKLTTYAFNLIHDKDLAEDIVQNVFLKIWKKRNKLKPDLSIQNLLYKSVYNEFIDQYRKSKKTVALEKKYIDALSTVVDEEDGQSLERLFDTVKKEIENLPPKCKQTFLLSKKEGLTNIEIAEHLDVSIKSVEKHISKAFSILRKKIDIPMFYISLLFLLI